MNCKQGDLAIVVRSVCGNEGKIVRCVSYLGRLDWHLSDGSVIWSETWMVDRALPNEWGVLGFQMEDAQLRPIRDPGEDAQDESKAWLPPVPHKETA